MKLPRVVAIVLTGQLVALGALGFAQGRSGEANPLPPAANAAAGRGGGGQVQTEQERKNIAAVMGFWKEIWENRDPKAPPKYMSPTYVEHDQQRRQCHAIIDGGMRSDGDANPALQGSTQVVEADTRSRSSAVLR